MGGRTLTVIARSQVVDMKDVKVCCVATGNVGAILNKKVIWRHMDNLDAVPALVFVARLCRLVESEIDH